MQVDRRGLRALTVASVYKLGKVFDGYTGRMYGADVPQVPTATAQPGYRAGEQEAASSSDVRSLLMLGMTDWPFLR